MKNFYFLLISFLIFSCNNPAEKTKTQSIYWVNSLKMKCAGVSAQLCLEIQKNKKLDPENWELFYDTIEGFEFEEGFIYKLLVNEEEIPKKEVPADGSSTKYTLVEVQEKEADGKLLLNESWMLVSVNEAKIEGNRLDEQPKLEIKMNTRKVIGHDGCNNFFGDIKAVDKNKLVFGTLAVTRKACLHMDIPDQINQKLKQIQFYKISDLNLYLYDVAGNEIFSLQKMD